MKHLRRFVVVSLLIGFGAAAHWEMHHVDNVYLGFLLGRWVRGESTSLCVDFPPEYWSRMPQCVGHAPKG